MGDRAGSSDDHRHAATAAQVLLQPGHHAPHPARPASSFTRFISGFQALSTLIGVPLALASGYTLYRTNFAPDTTCTNLRASIVSMLDKNVDPATRRMLVKRDIEAFEQSCGAVDPDAHAAFKALLSADKAVAQAVPAAKATPSPKPAAPVIKEASKETPKETPKDAAKESVKADLRPAIVEKKPVAAAAIEPEQPAQETAMSDTRWLDAVRQALVEQPAEPKTVAKQQPLVLNKAGEPVLQPSWTVTPPPVQPVAHGAAAPLPPPVPVVNTTAATVDPNRPVPPAPVPAAQYAQGGSWIAQIPFVGRMIDGRE